VLRKVRSYLLPLKVHIDYSEYPVSTLKTCSVRPSSAVITISGGPLEALAGFSRTPVETHGTEAVPTCCLVVLTLPSSTSVAHDT
jgi:hypothetical protein